MRKTVIPLAIIAFAVFINTIEAQYTYDLDSSIDPTELEIPLLFEHLDTSAKYHVPISLDFLLEEFPQQKSIQIETFYQKSAHHLLLKLCTGSIPLQRTFAYAEGIGATYFRISDSQCTVIFMHDALEDPLKTKSQIVDRSCAY